MHPNPNARRVTPRSPLCELLHQSHRRFSWIWRPLTHPPRCLMPPLTAKNWTERVEEGPSDAQVSRVSSRTRSSLRITVDDRPLSSRWVRRHRSRRPITRRTCHFLHTLLLPPNSYKYMPHLLLPRRPHTGHAHRLPSLLPARYTLPERSTRVSPQLVSPTEASRSSHWSMAIRSTCYESTDTPRHTSTYLSTSTMARTVCSLCEHEAREVGTMQEMWAGHWRVSCCLSTKTTYWRFFFLS